MVKPPDDEERPMLSAAVQPVADPPPGELERIFREKRGAGSAQLGEDPGCYLRRAAVNAGVDVLRSRRGSPETPLDKVEAVLPDAGQPAPDRAQGSRELRAEIRKALTTLSPRSAEIFALRYFEGYDNHEIAKMLGTSRSTVAVILHRTRNHLREAIREYVGE
jgi:RNA polymerase sigma-70 factor (ECF subfamily)